MTRFLDLLTRLPIWIGGVFLVGVGVITLGDVFARKFFGVGYFGLVDITQLAVVMFAYLSMPRAFLKGSHVAVELYDHKLSRRADLGLRVFSLILALGVLSVLIWYGWIRMDRVMSRGLVSQNVEIPMIWYWMPLVVGAGMSWLVCAIQLGQTVAPVAKGGAGV